MTAVRYKLTRIISPQTQPIFFSLICHCKIAVLCVCCPPMDVFQVNAKLVTAVYSQAVNLVQPEPKLTVQVAEAPFIVLPPAEEIYRAVVSFLKDRPTSTSCVLITVNFKFTQTIRIYFVHSTSLATRSVNFGAVFVR